MMQGMDARALPAGRQPRAFSTQRPGAKFGSSSAAAGAVQQQQQKRQQQQKQCSAARCRVKAQAHANQDGVSRRVVVTGMGLVSPLGHEVDEFYDNLLAGKSGVTEISSFDASGFSTRFAGEIKSLETDGYIARKQERRLDKAIKYVLVSGKKALGDAGLAWEGDEIKQLDKARCGILIGSAFGGMQTFSTAVEALETQSFKKMNPFCIPFAITNMSGALLAMDLGFMGPNYAINTACATGNYCITNAADHISRGDADLMLAGSADAAVIPSGIGGFIACKALSKRNADPSSASRPWDKERDGFVMGEGAGVLVLEELEHAKARGARIYAEYAGGAFSCDAHHMTEPQPEGKGVAHCLRTALASAGLQPSDVDYVNAHATSTPAGDMAEYRAIRGVLPHEGLRMNSTKSMIGHLLGGAGAVEAVATIKAITTGWVHPTINMSTPDDGVDPKLVCAGEKQQHDVKVALSNSFGFGGHNSCIIFKKF